MAYVVIAFRVAHVRGAAECTRWFAIAHNASDSLTIAMHKPQCYAMIIPVSGGARE